MLIADIHMGHHRIKEYLEKTVEETNQQNPDIILIAGDLLYSEAALLPGLLAPLSAFEAPVYYVEGNHEKEIDTDKAMRLIEEQGVSVMHNEVIDTFGLQIIGLDYMKPDENTFDMHPSDNKQTIKSVLPQLTLDNDRPVIKFYF